MWQNTPLDPFGALFLRADHCLIEGGVLGGENIITNAPQFARYPDPANNDYGDLRLLAGSPALDAGSNAFLPTDVADLDADGQTTEALPVDFAGRNRVINGTVDMGAFEGGFVTFSRLHPGLDPQGDANGNGYSNLGEYAFITDPAAPGNLSNRPRIRRTNEMLFLEYTRRANAVDLHFSLSRSVNLQTWSDAEEGIDYEIIDTVRHGENEDAEATVLKVYENPPRRFYRLEILAP